MIRVPEILALATGLMGPAALAGTAQPAARPAQPLPTPFPEGRYQQLCAKSPFAVASATTEAKAATTPDFAAQLYVDGVAHIGQTDYVAIKSRDPDKASTLFLQVGEVSKDGIKVDRVDWSEVMGMSTVQVSMNGKKATLAFDQALIAKSGPAVVPAPNSPNAEPSQKPVRLVPGYHPKPGEAIPPIFILR